MCSAGRAPTFNQGVRGSNPRWFTTKQGASWGAPCFFVERRRLMRWIPRNAPEKGKDISSRRAFHRRLAKQDVVSRGSNPRWFTNKTKTPANPCHYRAGGCFSMTGPSVQRAEIREFRNQFPGCRVIVSIWVSVFMTGLMNICVRAETTIFV